MIGTHDDGAWDILSPLISRRTTGDGQTETPIE
jgi:hypothetical protein